MKKIITSLLLVVGPVFSQSANTQITINLLHSQPAKYIALYVTDEVSKASVYAEPYIGKNQVNGTDPAGNFIRIIGGLTAGHTYSVTLLMDMDNAGSVDSGDIGKTITGIITGSSVVIDAAHPLTALENIFLAANAAPSFANKRAACVLSESTYVYPSIISAGAQFGLSGISVIFFDASGNAAWNNLWVPPGNHGNMVCMVDVNANNILDSGDSYAIGAKAGGSNTNYSLGAWSVVP